MFDHSIIMSRPIIKKTNDFSIRVGKGRSEEESIGVFRKNVNLSIKNISSSFKGVLISPGVTGKHMSSVFFNGIIIDADVVLKEARVLLNISGNLLTQGSGRKVSIISKGMKLTRTVSRDFNNLKSIVSGGVLEM